MAEDNIELSGGERLNRIERMLERILDKLDNKAEQASVAALESRVRDIEQHGSPNLQATIHDVQAIRDQNSRDLGVIRETTSRDLNSLREQAAVDANAIRQQVETMQRKLAYATGTIACIVFVVNIGVQFVK